MRLRSFSPLILPLLLLGGCVDRAAQKQAKATEKLALDKTVHVQLSHPETRDLFSTFEISGNLTTAEDTQIGAKQSGRVTAMYVKDGDQVSAGQLIATQDTAQLRAQLAQAVGQVNAARASLSLAISNKRFGPAKSLATVRQAEAALRSAKATLAKTNAGARPEERAQTKALLDAAKTNLDTAKKDLDRKKSLVEEGALARNALDTAENTYASALQQYNNALQAQLEQERGNRIEDVEVSKESVRQAEEQLRNAKAAQSLDITLDDSVNNAQSQLESAQAAVDLARSNLADAEIRAPFSGRISGIPIQPGTVVGPGTSVAHLIGGQGAYFEGQVPETMLQYAAVGTKVDVKVDALSGPTYSGVIAAVNPLGSSIGRLFKARIVLSGDLAGLKANMFARGTLKLKNAPRATVVPLTSVVTQGKSKFVFTVVDGKAKQVPVTAGLEVADVVQVTGVTSSDQIVVAGQDTLNDGDKVAIDEKLAGVAPATSSTQGS